MNVLHVMHLSIFYILIYKTLRGIYTDVVAFFLKNIEKGGKISKLSVQIGYSDIFPTKTKNMFEKGLTNRSFFGKIYIVKRTNVQMQCDYNIIKKGKVSDNKKTQV